MSFYNGAKLLSMKDINGNTPELYICTSNRSAGKTTYFNRYVVNRFLKYGEKFCLIYRFSYELDSVAETFFKDIGALFFAGYDMIAKKQGNGMYSELLISNGSDEYKPCGYAIALNLADQIKKKAHLLSDTIRMVFDEFQSETNHYCNDEVRKFISVHTSIARGQGRQSRYLPVYMIGNPVSLLNPYYAELRISERLNDKTRFLRGEGFVLEQGYEKSAAEAQANSAFNKAFSTNRYIAYSSENFYLNDSNNFIEKVSGKSRYICTLKYNGNCFAIREYAELGIIYCDDNPDMTFPGKLAVTTEDHNINYVMLKRNDVFLLNLRFFFERGCFRFKNLRCKEAVIKALSY